ncbi:MAG: tyrosine-type recombinase/integrase [Flavobacteriaceae bacterium]
MQNLLIGFKRYALYEREYSPNTIKDITNSLMRMNAFIKAKTIKDFSSEAIRNYLYTQREQLHWSPRTFINHRQYIKIFFNYCVSHGFINQNPIDKIKRPKVPQTLPRFLTSKQISSILINLELCIWRYKSERHRNKTIIYTLIFTGMRLNELINLKITDIDMEEKEILIRKGKGKKQRIIPIHPQLLPILEYYFSYLSKRQERSIWFFYNLRYFNKQMSGRSVQMLCEKLSKKSGVKFTPHWLRHTLGRSLTNAEVNVYKIKEILGHTNISTTQIYQSVAKQSLRESFCNTSIIG